MVTTTTTRRIIAMTDNPSVAAHLFEAAMMFEKATKP